jgi:hypothetical protein
MSDEPDGFFRVYGMGQSFFTRKLEGYFAERFGVPDERGAS